MDNLIPKTISAFNLLGWVVQDLQAHKHPPYGVVTRVTEDDVEAAWSHTIQGAVEKFDRCEVGDLRALAVTPLKLIYDTADVIDIDKSASLEGSLVQDLLPSNSSPFGVIEIITKDKVWAAWKDTPEEAMEAYLRKETSQVKDLKFTPLKLLA